MPSAKSPTAQVNLFVSDAVLRVIDRWMAWQVLYMDKAWTDLSRSSEIERVIAGEAARIKRLKGTRPVEALPEMEGTTTQINQRVPAHLLETITTYARQQQEQHGHTAKSMSRVKLINAALAREAERLEAEMKRGR